MSALREVTSSPESKMPISPMGNTREANSRYTASAGSNGRFSVLKWIGDYIFGSRRAEHPSLVRRSLREPRSVQSLPGRSESEEGDRIEQLDEHVLRSWIDHVNQQKKAQNLLNERASGARFSEGPSSSDDLSFTLSPRRPGDSDRSRELEATALAQKRSLSKLGVELGSFDLTPRSASFHAMFGSLRFPEEEKQKALPAIEKLISLRGDIIENIGSIMLLDQQIYDLNRHLSVAKTFEEVERITLKVASLKRGIDGLMVKSRESNRRYLSVRDQIGSRFKSEFQRAIELIPQKVAEQTKGGLSDFIPGSGSFLTFCSRHHPIAATAEPSDLGLLSSSDFSDSFDLAHPHEEDKKNFFQQWSSDRLLQALKEMRHAFHRLDDKREEFSRDVWRTTLVVHDVDGKRYLLSQNINESLAFFKINDTPNDQQASGEDESSCRLSLGDSKEAHEADPLISGPEKGIPRTAEDLSKELSYDYVQAIDHAYQLNPNDELLKLRDVNEAVEKEQTLGFVDRLFDRRGIGLIERYRIYSDFYQSLFVKCIRPDLVASEHLDRAKDLFLPLKERHEEYLRAYAKAAIAIGEPPSEDWDQAFQDYYFQNESTINEMNKSKILILDLQSRRLHGHFLFSYLDPANQEKKNVHHYHICYDYVRCETSVLEEPVKNFPHPEEVHKLDRFPFNL